MLSKGWDVNNDANATIHAIFETNRALRDAGERVAAAEGQTHARRMVLQASNGLSTVSEIARELGLQRQSVQRVSDELVQDGLARYEDNPHHRISRLVVLTTKGETVLAGIHRAHQQWIEELEQSVDDLDWTTVRASLDRIVQAIRTSDLHA